MILGIDATNITQGGGITHIKNILNVENKEILQFKKIIIWGNKDTLKVIKPKKNIKKIEVKKIQNKPIRRFIWQIYNFKKELIKFKCDHTLILGGIYFFNHIPSTLIMQNLLPFDKENIKKYRFIKKLKLFFQKKFFLSSILRAKNIIFLSKSSKKIILKSLKLKINNCEIIPHGIDSKLIKKKISKTKYFSKIKNFKILYVSKIEFYKNQTDLIKAAYYLNKKNYNVKVTFVGPSYEPALKKFIQCQKIYDPKKNFTEYLGNKSFKKTLSIYKNYDLHVIPSTCETFGQIVIEAMAQGIPNACSNIEVFKEVTNNNAMFFKNNVNDMVKIIEQLILSGNLRYKLSRNAIKSLKKKYSWNKTSIKTFRLINKNI